MLDLCPLRETKSLAHYGEHMCLALKLGSYMTSGIQNQHICVCRWPDCDQRTADTLSHWLSVSLLEPYPLVCSPEIHSAGKLTGAWFEGHVIGNNPTVLRREVAIENQER